MILLDNINLEKSFSKLKQSLIESENLLNDGKYYHYMNAYLNLKVAVNKHLYDYADITLGSKPSDPNDLSHVNI
jgi:hypothetical protein